jgi:outer membrane protein assembly factor BamB
MTATPLILLLAAPLFAQDAAMAPAVLPGNGLAQHDFFYAGEQKQHHMFIVKKGQVAWSYIDDASKGEISDAVLLSNGNILFAHQFGVTLIAPDKKVLWNYDAPAGAEVHTAQPIGTKHVLFIQNGDPATLRVVNISTNRTVREFPLPTGNPKSVHGHFRHARLTAAGTILVAHMDNKKVAEYDSSGKEVWSYAIDSPWSASRLPNGNTLIACGDMGGNQHVIEVDQEGKTVWEIKADELPGIRLKFMAGLQRLPNGNTVLCNWLGHGQPGTAPHLIEVTRDKGVVWTFFDHQTMKTVSSVQLLDVLGDAAKGEVWH